MFITRRDMFRIIGGLKAGWPGRHRGFTQRPCALRLADFCLICSHNLPEGPHCGKTEPMVDLAHIIRSPHTNPTGKTGPNSIDSGAGAFVANVDAAHMKEIFDVAKGQRKSDVLHHTKWMSRAMS